MLIFIGGGRSSNKTQWNPTEALALALDPPRRCPPGHCRQGCSLCSLSPVTTRPPHSLFHPANQSSSHTRDLGAVFPEKPASKWSRFHHAYFLKKSFKIYILKGCHFAHTSSRKEEGHLSSWVPRVPRAHIRGALRERRDLSRIK